MLVAMGRAKKGPEPSKLLRHKNTHLDEGPLWYTAKEPQSQFKALVEAM